ncbi:MAG: hypothetical protein HND58_19085 [Planctomycetota bacterium]|nr:MAG: hypothetical protein HND58_19085 [Planctomycetota bacterium]
MLRCAMVSFFGAVGLCGGVATAQPIEWLNPADGGWESPGNWAGGVVPDQPSHEPVLGLTGAYKVTSTLPFSVGMLTISNPDVVLEFLSTTRSIYGDLRNAGTVQLARVFVEFHDADRRIEGPGEIVFGAALFPSECGLVAEGVLVTQAAGHTIRGNGRMTNESEFVDAIGAFRNRGLIVADDAAGPGLELHSVTLEQIGEGRIGADGGTLFLTSNTETQVVETTVVGGELFITNGGSVRIGNTRSVLLSDLTITGPLVIDEADRELRLGGSIDLQGQISLNPSGTASNTELSHSLATTITGNGEIVLRTSGPNDSVFDSGALCTIEPGIVLRGSGDVFASSAGVVNNGVIVADDAAEALVLRGDFSGSGLYGANGGTLVLDTTTDLDGCTLTTQGGGVVVVDGFVDFFGGRNEGELEILPDAQPQFHGDYANNGTISQPVTDNGTELVSLRDGATISGTGVIAFGDEFSSGLHAVGGLATIGPEQTVFGEYTLDGDMLIEGTLEPDGRVEIDGDVELAPSALLLMDLGDGSGVDDNINLRFNNGSLTLGGALVLSLEDGLVPFDGQQWRLIDGEPDNELFGFFDTVVPPDGPPGFVYAVEVVASGLRVIATAASCPADFNGDGSVNTLDVLAFLNAWGAGDPSADFNGDGSVNTLDVLSFLNAWTAGC